MLDEKTFKRVSENWKGRIYQQWSKEKHRLAHFVKVAPRFKNLRVADMGCNAGLHAIDICQYAKSYLGIEMKKEFYDQAKETWRFIHHPDCVFVHANAVDYMVSHQPKVDALLLSFIIYHFSDDEIVALRDKILPSIPLVVVYNRIDRPTIKNSWNLHDPDRMVVFLRECGYETEFDWGRKRLYYCVIGRWKEKAL